MGINSRPILMAVAPTAEMDRHNGLIFVLSYLLIYFAAPVMYIGVMQAALCDKLGAGAAIANLPFATFQFGALAPLFCAWAIPHRLERAALVWANAITALPMALVLGALVLPFSPAVRIGAVVVQGLLQGFAVSTSQVFTLQCLNRGTSLEGRARAFQRAFALGPVFAVIGSLGAQYILNARMSFLPYPYDFALLYAVAVPCSVAITWLSSRYRLVHVADETPQPILRYLWARIRGYAACRSLALLWIAYLLWSCSLGAMANLSLYTKVAIGRDPMDFSGLIMAIRFGGKSIGGYVLGLLALRSGLRASVLATAAFFAAGIVWAWAMPGYLYLLAFGLLGAGELGGAYIPNFALALSPVAQGASNLSILTLATPISSFAPAAHGYLTDRVGFAGSFAFGLATAVAAYWIVTRIPRAGPD